MAERDWAKDGRITVVTGPMFSGKSEELIRRAKRLMLAGKKVKAYHHQLDRRFGENRIVSRGGFALESEPVEKLEFNKEMNGYDAFIVDEAQFFDESLLAFAVTARAKGKQVIVSGLDMDVFMNPFGVMPVLMAVADEVVKLKAVCFECGNEAGISYRLTDDEEQIVVGDKEYIAVCWRCYYLLQRR